MLRHSLAVIAIISIFVSTAAFASDIELDWESAEFGFVEETSEDGEALHGLAIYVPGSRMAEIEDFYTIVPEFCRDRLPGLLNHLDGMVGVPEFSFLNFQIDFLGSQVGEAETYIAGSVNVPLNDGECGPPPNEL